MKFKRFIEVVCSNDSAKRPSEVSRSFAERLKSLLQSESFETMLASEEVLRRDWDSPEEDAAWAHL